jgi:hypothetical protein
MTPRKTARHRVGLKWLDAVIIAVVLAGSGLLAWRVYSGDGTPPVLHIKGETGEWYYPLDRDREVKIRGPVGETVIVISRGEARVTESDCPEKICVRSAGIKRNGEWIACLPNRVLVTVEGSGGGGYDAESY